MFLKCPHNFENAKIRCISNVNVKLRHARHYEVWQSGDK